jgi:hypothetical protein
LIFDEGHFDMAHMMDWIISPWGILILGVIGLFLIAIIILYIMQRGSPISEDSVDLNTEPAMKDVQIDIVKEKPKYCSECGNQIDDREVDYCSLCGKKV